MTWNPVLNLKPKAEKFEERVTVKIIIEHITKALFIYIYSKGKKYLYFRTNLQSWTGAWCHRFDYVFNDKTRKHSFSPTSQIFGFEKMLLYCFYQEICFTFLPMGHENFRKM